MHSNLAHLLLTSNQQKRGDSNELAICSFTNNFHTGAYANYNRLILSDPERARIDHIRKGHQRYGHSQLAHTSQRDHKPTTYKCMYNPNIPIEIFFEILLKDSLHWRSLLTFLLVSFQYATLSLISRISRVYAQPLARKLRLDWADTGSGIVEAGCLRKLFVGQVTVQDD